MNKLSKKSVLLVAAVMALAAFSMPAMASASHWTVGGTTVSSNTAGSTESVGASGKLTLHSSVIAQSVSCAEAGSATLQAAGTASITTFGLSSCTTTISASCPVTGSASGLPWDAHLNSTATAVTVTGVNVANVFAVNANCGAFSGATLSASGNIMGAFTPGGETVVFNATSGLISPQVGAVDITGSVQITSPGGTVAGVV